MRLTRYDMLRGMLASAVVLPTAAAAQQAGGFISQDAGAGALPWGGAADIGARPLGFTIIADNTALARPGVFDQAMTQVSWLRPDFVMSIGDVIEGYSEDPAVVARRWDEADRSIAKLGCPFMMCGGNHDLSNPVYADAWMKRRGPVYYSFTYKTALFLVLCTEDPVIPLPSKAAATFNAMVDIMTVDPDRAIREMGVFLSQPEMVASRDLTSKVNISDAQVAWAIDTLARHRDPQWTFVMIHKPAWKSRDPQFAKIQAALANRPYTVIGGHTHYFTHEVIDGRDYINMGTCGGIRTQTGPGNMDHVMNVTLTPKGPVFANMRLAGLMDVAGQTGQTRAY